MTDADVDANLLFTLQESVAEEAGNKKVSALERDAERRQRLELGHAAKAVQGGFGRVKTSVRRTPRMKPVDQTNAGRGLTTSVIGRASRMI
jgi:hypothetical protein